MVESALQNVTEFRWTVVKHRAAVLLAEDDLSDEQIADELGISRQTLWRWKQHKDFNAQVGDHIGALQAAMLRLPIAKKRKRLKTLDTLHGKALAVIDARAAAMENDAPGTDTGLLVHQYKQIGSGREATTVDEYAVDVALMKEIRALEEQAAKELGQWIERSESDIRTNIVQLVGVEVEDI